MYRDYTSNLYIFFVNDTATTEIYTYLHTLSLHDALPIYGPQARERGLALRMVPSSQVIHSDPHLLERILGNLLSNAVRYTSEGSILLGCRRCHGKLRI